MVHYVMAATFGFEFLDIEHMLQRAVLAASSQQAKVRLQHLLQELEGAMRLSNRAAAICMHGGRHV